MKMSLTACPSSELLREFFEGEIDEALVEEIQRHLDVCTNCRRKIEYEPYQDAWAKEIQSLASQQAEAPVDVTVPLARLNKLLPDYEILSEIGRGGMGIVYHARQRNLNRDVALKVLPSLLAAFRPDARARFQREAELAARLKHGSIIAIHDYGEVEGTLYYAMELVEGRSLSELIDDLQTTRIGRALTTGRRRSSDSHDVMPSGNSLSTDESLGIFFGSSKGPPPSDSAIRRAYFQRIASWIADVAEGLEFAHTHGVTHRDIKPSNLLLTRDNRVMISDFGLARSRAMETITIGASLLGTARYMSPEQIDGTRGSSDHRVDVYSLGATMYELLTLQPLFATRDDRKVLHQVLNDEPAKPRRVLSAIPAELETICLKALEKDPAIRYQSAQAFADDLRRWLLGMPILAKPQGALIRTGKFMRRRKALVALAISCGLMLIGSTWTIRFIRSERALARKTEEEARIQRIELLLRRGEEQNNKGFLHQALQFSSEGLELEPRSIKFMELRIRTLALMDRDKEALDAVQALIQEHPEDWTGYYHAAVLLKSAQNMTSMVIRESSTDMADDQRQTLYERYRDRLAELRPDSPQIRYLLASEMDDPKRALELLELADKSRPRLVEILIAKANRFLQIGDYDSMLRDADVLLAIRNGWSIAHSLRGSALNQLNRMSESIEEYSKAIELDPTGCADWFNRSMAYSTIGRFESALADAREALRRDPEYSLAYAACARAKIGMGQTSEAIKDLTHGLKVSPENIELVLERARLYLEFGQFSESVADSTRSIELAPSDARGYLGRSLAYSRMDQLSRALSDLDRAAELEPENPSVYQQMATVSAASGDLKGAVEDLDKALAIRPNAVSLYGDRASLNLLLQRYSDAIHDLTRVLDSRRVGADILLMTRGMAYELSGDTALASIDYEKALKSSGPVRDYATLWLYILSRTKGNEANAKKWLADDNTPDQSSGWPARLISFYRGTIDETELLKQAITESERCEAQYYVGMKKLIEGNESDGYAKLKECARSRKYDILEVVFAQCRLKGDTIAPLSIR